MQNINPINLGVNANYYKPEEKDNLAKEADKESKSGVNEKKQIGTKEVLGFMAAQNADIIPVKTQRTYNVSKYVTPEQEARIASFMQKFESNFNVSLNAAKSEFPKLSDKAAEEIALANMNEFEV